MQFFIKRKRHVLKGSTAATVKSFGGKYRNKTLAATVHSATVKLYSMQLEVTTLTQMASLATVVDIEVNNPALLELLDEFSDLFAEPKGLPPHRSYDHKIVLKKGAAPINLKTI
jgi:hypothetical protein